MKRLKVGLDIDGVLASFQQGFIDLGNELGLGHLIPATRSEWTSWHPCDEHTFETIWSVLKNDPSFWLNLPRLVDPRELNLVTGPWHYITARPVGSEVSLRWLLRNGFPVSQVDTVGRDGSKLEYIIDADLDFFIEDRYEAFLEINENTFCACFLLRTAYNQDREIPEGFEHLVVDHVKDYLVFVDQFQQLINALQEEGNGPLAQFVRTNMTDINAGQIIKKNG